MRKKKRQKYSLWQLLHQMKMVKQKIPNLSLWAIIITSIKLYLAAQRLDQWEKEEEKAILDYNSQMISIWVNLIAQGQIILIKELTLMIRVT